MPLANGWSHHAGERQPDSPRPDVTQPDAADLAFCTQPDATYRVLGLICCVGPKADRRSTYPARVASAAMMMVSDLRHFLDLPVDRPGPARRLADRLGRIVSAATAGDVGEPWTTAVRCERRPGRRPCPGSIGVVRAEPESSIRWWCSNCEDEGVISGWRGSPYDLLHHALRAAGHQVQVPVERELGTVLQAIPTLDFEAARLVFRARSTDSGVVLTGSSEALEDLAEHVAAEANHERNRRRQRILDAALDVLESTVVKGR